MTGTIELRLHGPRGSLAFIHRHCLDSSHFTLIAANTFIFWDFQDEICCSYSEPPIQYRGRIFTHCLRGMTIRTRWRQIGQHRLVDNLAWGDGSLHGFHFPFSEVLTGCETSVRLKSTWHFIGHKCTYYKSLLRWRKSFGRWQFMSVTLLYLLFGETWGVERGKKGYCYWKYNILVRTVGLVSLGLELVFFFFLPSERVNTWGTVFILRYSFFCFIRKGRDQASKWRRWCRDKTCTLYQVQKRQQHNSHWAPISPYLNEVLNHGAHCVGHHWGGPGTMG